jgi:glycine cleavage system H protein
MKEISELTFLEDVRYSKEHEWVRAEGDAVKVGISDFAQDQLGDVVFVELPQAGDSFEAGEVFGTVESVKTVSELYMPMGGEIVSVNNTLEESPEFINDKPYEDGWMIVFKPNDMAAYDDLLSHEEYKNFLAESQK